MMNRRATCRVGFITFRKDSGREVELGRRRSCDLEGKVQDDYMRELAARIEWFEWTRWRVEYNSLLRGSRRRLGASLESTFTI